MKKTILTVVLGLFVVLMLVAANSVTINTYRLDTTGSISTRGAKVMWVMFYADEDNGQVVITDSSRGDNEHFSYENNDISANGEHQFFNIGGQRWDGIYLKTLTTGCTVWIGMK